MNRVSLWTIVLSGAALVASPAVLADDKDATDAALIARAMSAGPMQIAAQAKIMDHDGSVLREGSNGWTCMPSMGPGMDVPMCNDATWMAFMQAFAHRQAPNPVSVGISYMFGGDIATNNDDPFDTTQDPGEPWVTEGPHIMVIVPDPESSLKDMTNDPDAGGPYVMYKNTPYAHIMIPTGPRPVATDK
ncbi:hypothetical protein FKV24_004935 [Lysobacter maris]|uniref:Uncharacterized protein n=1 Tax=Marilutibacter maris TaxID=1605891 RepID=A0A508B4C6_9GAMM|nr:hypothetical protein [Lysobacter maris]KAB8195617.1 hypothetical protein FKV24_004935 [Lysobacter maris]